MSRVRSNFITNRLADGAPTASLGLIISGVTTSTTLSVDDKIVHTGDTNTAIRFPATDTITAETSGSERLRITSTGLVGIGTDTPAQPVHISRGSAVARIQSTDASTSARLEIIGANDSYSGLHMGDVDDVDVGAIRYYHAGSDPNHMSFRTGGSEKLRINSSGKILIGSSTLRNVGSATANSHLQIEGTTVNTSSVSLINNQASTGGPNLSFTKTRGTSTGAVTTVADGDILGNIKFCGADGTDIENFTANIKAIVNGTVAGDQIPTDLVFETSPTGSGSRTERLRITSAGNVGINTEIPSATLEVSDIGSTGPLILLNGASSTEGDICVDHDENLQMGHWNKSTSTFTERMSIPSTGYVQGNINVPCWFGSQDTAHNITTATWTTLINLGNSVVNPSMNNGGWDESTGVFTVQAGQAGVYICYAGGGIDDIQDSDIVRVGLSKNDANPSIFAEQRCIDEGGNIIVPSGTMTQLFTLAEGDTLRAKIYHNEGTTEATEPNRVFFGGYRIAV